jgi:hypothetical protein
MELGLVFNMLYNIRMKFINKNWEKLVLISYILITPVVSFAQTNSVTSPGQNSVTSPSNPSSSGMIVNPLGTTNTLPVLIQNALKDVITIGIPIVALAIIYCGFLFVFARGNSEKLTKAKDALLYTIIGAAILLGALAIAQMISGTVSAL